MVALRIQDHQRGNGSRPHQELAERIRGHYGNIAHRRRSITNVAVCFRDQPAMLPLQCTEAIARLISLRSAAYEVAVFLETLDPEDTKRLKPFGCIAKLAHLDYQTSRAILALDMFAPICQSVTYDRVELHLFIRSLFPCVLATFEDATSQLAALVEQQREVRVCQ